ncbi:MAG: hypothetical protein KIT11_08495 [Fimbriimonadaceae bacterium]|nr:hypothetical protein [Fimbriimonadaceae bacterium]QYK56392.1 MAG: hypothetical protein KF733_02690 [Fimbriimonadaceae bacterium]
MRRLSLALPLLALAAGCAPGDERFFPLESGNRWSYTVFRDFDTIVTDVRVQRPVRVGTAQGWLLSGETGESRLAWKGSRLVAGELGGTVFVPPVPIFAESERTTWDGQVEVTGVTKPGTAELIMGKGDVRFSGRSVPARTGTLRLKSDGHEMELTSWFVEGIGIARQEQRRDGRLVRRLEYLGGP